VQAPHKHKLKSLLFSAALVTVCMSAVSVAATKDSNQHFGVDVEFGAGWIARNDVRIPGDTGTEFDMAELAGEGPEFLARLGGTWQINDAHSVRLVLAPLEVEGRGTLEQATDFAGETFAAGMTDASYKFNTYKFSYRYTFAERDRWHWRVGVTAVIRDADVDLRQGSLRANDDNVGVVPTLHLSGEYRVSDQWRLSLDLDGLAGGPGRLFDAALKLDYVLSPRWRVSAGYRIVEGGVDTDDVYNFGWFNYAVLGLDYRFGTD